MRAIWRITATDASGSGCHGFCRRCLIGSTVNRDSFHVQAHMVIQCPVVLFRECLMTSRVAVVIPIASCMCPRDCPKYPAQKYICLSTPRNLTCKRPARSSRMICNTSAFLTASCFCTWSASVRHQTILHAFCGPRMVPVVRVMPVQGAAPS